MNTFKNSKSTKTLATIAGLVAVLPAMIGGALFSPLINISDNNVDVLSPDCEQKSEQTQIGYFGVAIQNSEQKQDCDVVDIL